MSRTGTGWFGMPGTNKDTKVHFVIDGKPLCGSIVGDKMVYQWCSPHFNMQYVGCKHCKRIVEKSIKAYTSQYYLYNEIQFIRIT